MDTPTQDTHPSPTATEPLTGDEGAREWPQTPIHFARYELSAVRE
jgi:hypothetical protein